MNYGDPNEFPIGSDNAIPESLEKALLESNTSGDNHVLKDPLANVFYNIGNAIRLVMV